MGKMLILDFNKKKYITTTIKRLSKQQQKKVNKKLTKNWKDFYKDKLIKKLQKKNEISLKLFING